MVIFTSYNPLNGGYNTATFKKGEAMKKKSNTASYVSAEVEIVLFECNDIVTASGGGEGGSTQQGGKVDGYWD